MYLICKQMECTDNTMIINQDTCTVVAVHREQMWQWTLPARLLIKVLSDPGEGLHSHQTGHVNLLHVVCGGQHNLVGVSLDGWTDGRAEGSSVDVTLTPR